MGGERDLKSDVIELLNCLCGVLEANLAPMNLSDNALEQVRHILTS